MTSIEETIETEEYRLSDYVKETNKKRNRLLKSVKKKIRACKHVIQARRPDIVAKYKELYHTG